VTFHTKPDFLGKWEIPITRFTFFAQNEKNPIFTHFSTTSGLARFDLSESPEVIGDVISQFFT